MQKVLVILGQTATGKSKLAVQIAKKIDGEIISADSRQVYKGMNIGTGKITRIEMRDVRHHLLSFVNPKKQFTVAEYKKLAEKKIKEIIKRKKIPIIVGGTGFYLDALTKGITLPEVPPENKLRKKLGKKSAAALFKMLIKLDSNRAQSIDPKNKVRLIRAIEIAKSLGKVPKLVVGVTSYEFIKVGLFLPNEMLKKRIEERVHKMFKKGLLLAVVLIVIGFALAGGNIKILFQPCGALIICGVAFGSF
ncbi:MAG: tRNA (adenosine(37)-N6)-dimethylallyltransferase MiaA, partial [Candidatus Paceibacterales bacterium]